MSTTLLQSFREIAEACPCRPDVLGGRAAMCREEGCRCAAENPEGLLCFWPGHASLRKAAGEMHDIFYCRCCRTCAALPGTCKHHLNELLVCEACADLRRRLMEVIQ